MSAKLAFPLGVLILAAAMTAQGAESREPIAGNKYTFLVPLENVDSNIRDTCGLLFKSFEEHTGAGMIERLTVRIRSENGRDTLILHRRTDNGTAGSGRVYFTALDKKELPDGVCMLDAQITATETYRQGLIGRFAVPEFSLEAANAVLASAMLDLDGSFISELPVDGVLARLPSTGRAENTYNILVSGKEVPTKINCTRSSGQTRCQYAATISGTPQSDGKLSFVEAVRQFSDQMNGIPKAAVNSAATDRNKKTLKGTSICQNRAPGDEQVYAFTEDYAEATGKIQVRLYRTSSGKVINEIIWDDPDNWYLCEQSGF